MCDSDARMCRRRSPGRPRRSASVGAEGVLRRSGWTGQIARPRTSASAEPHHRRPAPGWFHPPGSPAPRRRQVPSASLGPSWGTLLRSLAQHPAAVHRCQRRTYRDGMRSGPRSPGLRTVCPASGPGRGPGGHRDRRRGSVRSGSTSWWPPGGAAAGDAEAATSLPNHQRAGTRGEPTAARVGRL